MERSGNDQATDCQGEKTGRCLGNDDVEVLLHAVDTAEEKAHSQDKQQVGQNTANQRGLHNDDLVLDQGNDGDDQFDGITERSVKQTADCFARAVLLVSGFTYKTARRPTAERFPLSRSSAWQQEDYHESAIILILTIGSLT